VAIKSSFPGVKQQVGYKGVEFALHLGQASSCPRAEGLKSKQIAHGFANAIFGAANSGYNITTLLCNIL
jgi:hypothetical protein